MSKKDTKTKDKTVCPSVYIIEVVIPNIGTYDKVGFTDVEDQSRPQGLVKKYLEQNPKNSVKLLKVIKLPLKQNKKYFNDNQVRDALIANSQSKIIAIDKAFVAQNIGVDGKQEFVEVLDNSLDIVAEVEKIINLLAQDKNNFKYDIRNIVKYASTQKHLVNGKHLMRLEDKALGYQVPACRDKKILLVGQYPAAWLAALAYNNTVVCLTDAADQRPNFNDYTNLNDKITYANNLEEIIDMNITFDLIINNPPYGNTGDNITDTIIENIKRKEFINLIPLKDYSLKTGRYLDFSSIITFQPHSFTDADILTHAVRILDKPNDNIKTDKDLGAAAFTVDKPMIRFMRDNLLKYHYAFDNIRKFDKDCEVSKTFVYHHFDTGSQHTCGMPKLGSDIPKNKYNLQNIDESVDGILYGVDKAIRLNTSIEKDCLVHIYKLARNFINRMFASQFISIRNSAACWPKVDLTNTKWLLMTTEAEVITAIMKEVNNSTDDEIKAVLDTMNKDYFISNDDDIERLFGDYLK